jgi:hypothetical protein
MEFNGIFSPPFRSLKWLYIFFVCGLAIKKFPLPPSRDFSFCDKNTALWCERLRVEGFPHEVVGKMQQMKNLRY